jgi:hypothetical protein
VRNDVNAESKAMAPRHSVRSFVRSCLLWNMYTLFTLPSTLSFYFQGSTERMRARCLLAVLSLLFLLAGCGLPACPCALECLSACACARPALPLAVFRLFIVLRAQLVYFSINGNACFLCVASFMIYIYRANLPYINYIYICGAAQKKKTYHISHALDLDICYCLATP